MSHINLCRLCLRVCNDCKILNCASGQTNEIYDITVKYFHTMFLNVDQSNQNTVMCLECWHHISEFHSYQQSVFEAQRKLLNDESFMEYKYSIQSIACMENASCSIPIKEEDEDSMSYLEFKEEFSYCNTLHTVRNEDHSYSKPAYNLGDSANVGTIHNGLYNANEDISIRTAFSPKDSEKVDTIHNGLHNTNDEISIRTAYNTEDSENVGIIHNELHKANEDTSIRTVNNPEDSENFETIYSRLHNDNDETSIRTSYDTEDSANVGIIYYELHNANGEDPSIRTVYIPEDSENVATIHNGLYSVNVGPSIRTAYNPEGSTNVGTIHNGLSNDNAGPSIRTVYNPEDSANIGTIHNGLSNDNAGPSMRTAYHPEGLANVATIHNGLHNANEEDPSLRTAYNPEGSANVTTITNGLYNANVVDPPANLGTTNTGLSSDLRSWQQTSPIKPKQSIVQPVVGRFLSKYREHLECVHCGIISSSFSLLELHFRQDHPTDRCYISCCRRRYPNRAIAEEHARFHKYPSDFKCPKCDLQLTSTTRLHKRQCFGDGSKVPGKPAIRKSYSYRIPPGKIDDFIAICKPNLECVICHETCQRFTELRMHFENKHPKAEFFVMCCQRKFRNRSQFKEHVWLDVDPDAFKCNMCGINMSRYYSLQLHMLRVHNTTLYTSLEDIGAKIRKSRKLSLQD